MLAALEPRNAGAADLDGLFELEVAGQANIDARYCTECTWGMTKLCDRIT